MNTQRSRTFWIILLLIVLFGFVILFPKYGFFPRSFTIAEARGLAANLTSSSAANYLLRKKHPGKGIAIANCSDVLLIANNRLPKNFEIKNQKIKTDQVIFCTLVGPRIPPLEFSVIGIN